MANVVSNSTVNSELYHTELMSCTQYPEATIYCVWHNSRSSEYVYPARVNRVLKMINNSEYSESIAIRSILRTFPEYDPGVKGNKNYLIRLDDDTPLGLLMRARKVIKKVVTMVLKLGLQVTDFVSITFFTEGLPNSLRDQLVRQRVKVWAQTSRTITDLSTMDVFRAPEVEIYGGSKAVEIYDKAVDQIREAYRQLQSLGVRPEDIRLQPHNVRYGLNWGGYLREVLHTINQRLSFYAQITLWAPLLIDVYKILRSQFDPEIIDELVGVNQDVDIDENFKVVRYGYELEAEARYKGFDKMMVCDPLWLNFKGLPQPEGMDIEHYDRQKSIFIELWNSRTCKAAGWDKESPDLIGPYDRPLSILKSQYPEVYEKYWK